MNIEQTHYSGYLQVCLSDLSLSTIYSVMCEKELHIESSLYFGMDRDQRMLEPNIVKVVRKHKHSIIFTYKC